MTRAPRLTPRSSYCVTLIEMPAARTPTTPNLNEFTDLARTHTLVPVTRTVAADLETPVSAFLRVAAHEPEAFLLESVEGGETIGRYTFIGIRPFRTMPASGNIITETPPGAAPITRTAETSADPNSDPAGTAPARPPGL